MDESSPARANPDESDKSKRRLVILVAVAVIGIVLASVVSHLLFHRAQSFESHLAAPDRPVRDAPFITSPDVVVDKMVEVANLSADDVVYDLGCGDGRIIVTAAMQSGCRGVGIDNDPVRVAEARENAKLHGVDHLIEIREQDLRDTDLREADVVMCYLLPLLIKSLIPQLQEMKSGSRFFSHDFSFGEINYIRPDQTWEVYVNKDESNHQVHLWEIPLDVPAED
jgi:SAM-dependent methyltransferase